MLSGQSGFIERLVRRAQSHSQDAARQAIQAEGEWGIWRRQKIGERRPQADNAMGTDVAGTTFETVDHPIQLQEGGPDHDGEKSFFVSAPCTSGDFIVQKRGTPQTPEDARAADMRSVYRVTSYNLKHDSEGNLVYNKVTVVPDRSGQW